MHYLLRKHGMEARPWEMVIGPARGMTTRTFPIRAIAIFVLFEKRGQKSIFEKIVPHVIY